MYDFENEMKLNVKIFKASMQKNSSNCWRCMEYIPVWLLLKYNQFVNGYLDEQIQYKIHLKEANRFLEVPHQYHQQD